MKLKATIGRYLPTWIATLSLAASLFGNFKQNEKIDDLESKNKTLTEQYTQAKETAQNLTTATEGYEGAIAKFFAKFQEFFKHFLHLLQRCLVLMILGIIIMNEWSEL